MTRAQPASPGSSLSATSARDVADREAAERELAQRGVALPTVQSIRWMRLHAASDGVTLVVRDGAGVPRAALGASIARSRALPGHRVYRVERLSAGPSAEHDRALLEALLQLARDDRRCLRLIVELFERDPESRDRLGAMLRDLGFARVEPPRMYARTVALDLRGTEEQLFAALSKTARQNIRAPAKRGLEVRVITDTGLAPRIDSLLEQTFARTDGDLQRQSWDRIIAWSAAEPNVSRVVGLFDPQTQGAESLVSMSWGCFHGPYATYEMGAGVRRPDLRSISVSYAPLWDLIAWARRQTPATWFDLGGASSGTASDALRGNLEFKRYFSEQLVEVGQEWRLEPHAGRAAIARVIAAAARMAGRATS